MSKHAVVVGLNYANFPQDSQLTGAANDAAAIGRLLRERAGFDAVRMLPAASLNSKSADPLGQLSCAEMEQQLYDLFVTQEAGAPQLVLFFFAGHGVRKETTGESYLVTSDADLGGNWGVSLNNLSKWLARSPATHKIIWLDCCHSGGLPTPTAAPDLLSAAPDGPSAHTLLAACRASQPAYELQGQGLLTKALLDAFTEHTGDGGYLDTDLLSSLVFRNVDQNFQQPVRSYFGPTIPLIGERRDGIVAAQRNDENPYRGLEAFEKDHQAQFFGRRALIQTMVQRLQKPENRFLAVVGASGSGKSSVVQAGLLYELNELPPDKGRWVTCRMVPGERPFQRLRDALVKVSSADVDEAPEDSSAADWLARTSACVIRDGSAAHPAPERLLLFVDQFEELFTQTPPAVRDHFIACLINAHKASDSTLTVVIALRADFYGACTTARFAGLADLIRDHQINLLPMDDDELREAIAEPARRHGWRVERDLEKVLVREALGNAGRLPLLQHGLRALWDHSNGAGKLALDAYRALAGGGDLAHVLTHSADAAFEDAEHPQYLEADEQEAARHL